MTIQAGRGTDFPFCDLTRNDQKMLKVMVDAGFGIHHSIGEPSAFLIQSRERKFDARKMTAERLMRLIEEGWVSEDIKARGRPEVRTYRLSAGARSVIENMSRKGRRGFKSSSGRRTPVAGL